MRDFSTEYDFLQRGARAIASILGVDITILDHKGYRIAGTGIYEVKIGEQVPPNFAIRRVLKNKKNIIMYSPGEENDCLNCIYRENCMEKAVIAVPILGNDGEVLGSIGVISFETMDQHYIMQKTEQMLDFVKHMSTLFASKMISDRMTTNLLQATNKMETLLDFVEEGVIAVDNLGIITHFNHAAVELTGLNYREVIGKDVNLVFPGLPLHDVLRVGKGFSQMRITLELPAGKRSFLCNAKLIKGRSYDNGVIANLSEPSTLSAVRKNEQEQRQGIKWQVNFERILGESRAFSEVINQAQKAALSSSTVLIRGESGTGKELFARAIHHESSRRKKQFMTINCSAIPENLLESELFGYEEGSFTGARKGGKIGKFEMADKGTLFLDEIGDMPYHLQAKILRVLEESSIEKVGGSITVPIDVRIIAATNVNLENMIELNKFRHDLYYRLNVIPLFIPPLRERKEDIALLMEHFLAKYNMRLNKNIKGFSPQVFELFMKHSWPGNIRELENVIEYVVNMETGNYINVEYLPPSFRVVEEPVILKDIKDNNTMEVIERDAIIKALDRFGWSTKGKLAVAKSLGIGKTTLYRKLKKYDIRHK
jgi:sigma-54 dependent transcriptional regulator, acetoin dehydrogenase operon transcriptional activator AcoR